MCQMQGQELQCDSALLYQYIESYVQGCREDLWSRGRFEMRPLATWLGITLQFVNLFCTDFNVELSLSVTYI